MVSSGKKHDGGVSLPEDIVFDVLARLPAKALCRFRCVCKGWRALISDPAFVAAQRSRAGPHLVGVFYGDRTWPPEVRVMDMDGNVVRAFREQLLRKDDGTDDILGRGRLDLICANNAMFIDPAAGRACTIDMDTPYAMPTFGCAALSGAFKVICLQDASPSQMCKVATMTVEGGAEPLAWRQRSAPPFVTSWHPEKRASVNGIVYFMPRRSHHDAASDSGSSRIAAFDLESEEWKMINGPAFGIQAETWLVSLTELKGTLGVVQCLRDDDDHYYANIWLLIDFNKSVWVKEYTIHRPKTWGLTKLLGALDDGRILLLVRETTQEVITEENKISYDYRDVLVFYNPNTKLCTNFKDIAMGYSDILVLYTGSLIC